MWNKKAGTNYRIAEILSAIIRAQEEQNIEGITILGGEPFQQYKEVFELVKRVVNLNLSVILYSGYEMQELQNLGLTEIFNYIDILIAGRYIEEQRDTDLYLRGSTNQQLLFFSEKYQDFDSKNEGNVEITINEFGQLQIMGYPDDFFDLIDKNNKNLINIKQLAS